MSRVQTSWISAKDFSCKESMVASREGKMVSLWALAQLTTIRSALDVEGERVLRRTGICLKESQDIQQKWPVVHGLLSSNGHWLSEKF